MELEKWLESYDIRKMVMDDLERYLKDYKNEYEEDYNELFEGIDINKVAYVFHSVSYVINTYYIQDDPRKYIVAKVRLEYDDTTFAEYSAFYGLDGEFEDDYLLKV